MKVALLVLIVSVHGNVFVCIRIICKNRQFKTKSNTVIVNFAFFIEGGQLLKDRKGFALGKKFFPLENSPHCNCFVI